VDVDELARALADRLARIVPDGFHVEASRGMLWYSCEAGRFPGQQGTYEVGSSGSYLRENLGRRGDDAPIDVQIAAAAENALDELQDYIDEATHDPWPGDRTVPPAHAEVRDSMLHIWYGRPGEVVLACEPISLRDII
jgi:hypothetical protein